MSFTPKRKMRQQQSKLFGVTSSVEELAAAMQGFEQRIKKAEVEFADRLVKMEQGLFEQRLRRLERLMMGLVNSDDLPTIDEDVANKHLPPPSKAMRGMGSEEDQAHAGSDSGIENGGHRGDFDDCCQVPRTPTPVDRQNKTPSSEHDPAFFPHSTTSSSAPALPVHVTIDTACTVQRTDHTYGQAGTMATTATSQVDSAGSTTESPKDMVPQGSLASGRTALDLQASESVPAQNTSARTDSTDTFEHIQKWKADFCEVVKNTQFNYTSAEYKALVNSTLQMRERMYEFQPSAWDVGMMPFVRMLNKGNSLFVVMLLVLNVSMQFTLMWCIFSNFTLKDIDEDFIKGLTKWRVSIAHDARWMDTITQESLARKVCQMGGAEGGLYMSGSVQTALTDVLQYRPDLDYLEKHEGFLEETFVDTRPAWIGSFMCMSALIIWWVTCYIELKSWVDCAEGIWLLPRGQRTKLILLESTEEVAVASMSRSRKIYISFVLFVRLGVFVTLLYTGTQYLLNTLDLRDLILNAVALAAVLNLDELLYSALIPFHVRHFMFCLAPMPKMKAPCVYKFIDFEVVAILAALGCFVSVCTAELNTLSTQLIDAKEALCGGYLDFVYTIDPAGAVVAMPTRAPDPNIPTVGDRPIAGHVQPTEDNYRWLAVQEIIHDWRSIQKNPEHSLSDNAASLSGSRLGLLERSSMHLGQRMSELNPYCSDFNNTKNGSRMVWPTKFIVSMIRGHMERVGVTSFNTLCSQTAAMCNWDNETGISLRQWCSHTCGCDSPKSSLILTRDTMGCPHVCTTGHHYSDEIRNGNCSDHHQSSTDFKAYITGIREIRQSYSHNKDWGPKFDQWANALETHGCSAHNIGVFGDLCGDTAFGLKPIHFLCPSTCNCSQPDVVVPAGQARLCPRSCTVHNVNHQHHTY